MLLQAADFLELHRTLGVELQMGGADQWGNITAGLELIRRVEGQPTTRRERAHGLSYPLLLDPQRQEVRQDGGGDLGLARSGQRTSPYAFYQFWLDRRRRGGRPAAADVHAPRASRDRGDRGRRRAGPEARLGQRVLASGPDRPGPRRRRCSRGSSDVSEAVFSRTLPPLGPEALAFAFEQLPNAVVAREPLAGGTGRAGRRGRALQLERRGPPDDQPGRPVDQRGPGGIRRRAAARRCCPAATSSCAAARRPTGSSGSRRRPRPADRPWRSRRTSITAAGSRPRSASRTSVWNSRSADLAAQGGPGSRPARSRPRRPPPTASSLAAIRTSVASSVTLRPTASTPPSRSPAV